MERKFIVFLLKSFFGLTSIRKIHGLENIPTTEPTIITGNHIGILDGIMIPTIPGIANHPNLIVVIAEKYEKKPILKWAIDHLNFMFIDRFKPDIRTIKNVLSQLKNNGLLIISPEGTRSPDASLIEGKSGPAYLAAKTGANIVPIGVIGTEDRTMKSRFRKLKRLRVSIDVGKPFKIPALPHQNRDEFLQKYTDEIMCQIAALLPASYRGIYHNHPRLIELLNAANPTLNP
jgi:1-acyl-sn-glycerol-3-phosphate acyltransferase